MFCSKQTNTMIKKLHERVFRIVLYDQTSNFETLLVGSNICNHHRNIQALMTEAYKIQNNLAPPTMQTILERKTIPYNLKLDSHLPKKLCYWLD